MSATNSEDQRWIGSTPVYQTVSPILFARTFVRKSLSLSLPLRCRVSRLTRYFISHVVKTVGRVLSYKRFRRNRWKSKLEPYRSLTLIVPRVRNSNISRKAWVYKLVFDDFWELMRWKVNVHFFLSFYVFGININLKNDKLRRIFIFINLILSTKIKHHMILDFSSYNLVVYFYIFILKSTRNLLRSKKNSVSRRSNKSFQNNKSEQ